jgi:protocatechuate 3,4-dioxygenase beta subunit
VRHLLTSVFCVFLASAQAPETPKTARIEGRVRTVAGAPVPKATIQLLNSANGLSPAMLISKIDGSTVLAGRTTTTDDSGNFVLENVPPGRNYRLSAMRPGYLTGFYGTRSTANPPVLLMLNAGDTIRDLVIEMLEQGTVSGRVTDADGDPVVGALVTISQPRYNRGVLQMASVAAQTTDDRGVYRFASLNRAATTLWRRIKPIAGERRSRVSSPGSKPISGRITPAQMTFATPGRSTFREVRHKAAIS